MAKYGLTEAGFVIPTLNDLIVETKQSLIRAFGENFNVQSNSVADKLTTIFNEREYQLILMAASVYVDTETNADSYHKIRVGQGSQRT